MVLGLSQEKLGAALGVTFQQVQKYEKGTNRVSTSRLQQVSQILQVPAAHFFESAPGQQNPKGNAQSTGSFFDFIATQEGLAPIEAFSKIKPGQLRRQIVQLVSEFAGG
jgi:transcriptional regulator with XRE-family HTH domain